MSVLDPNDERLLHELNRHPHLKHRIEALVRVVGDGEGDLARADAAERRVMEEIRQMGQASLQAWAERQVEQTGAGVTDLAERRRGGKKTLLA